MKRLVAIALCVAMPIAIFGADNGYKVAYDGGSIPDLKAGVGMKLYIDARQIRL